MASWTNGELRIVSKEDIKASWNGGKNGIYFRCYLCGEKFKVGDRWRFLYNSKGPNCMVCESCNGTSTDVLERFNRGIEEFEKLKQTRFWWMFKE